MNKRNSIDFRLLFLSLMLCGLAETAQPPQTLAQEATAPDLIKPCSEIKNAIKYMSVPGYANCAVIVRAHFDNDGKVKSYLIVRHPLDKTGKSSNVADLAVQIAVKALPDIKAIKELNSAKPVWIYLVFDNRVTPKNKQGKMNYYVSDKLGIYADQQPSPLAKPI